MPIQHRNIIDEERHEIKGSDVALSGTVPVANGIGGTSFQRIGVGQMSGSIPTAVGGLTLVTDGEGGFTSTSPIYARLRTAHPPSTVWNTTVWNTTVFFASPTGVVADGSAIVLTTSGYYWYSLESLTLDTSTTPNSISYGFILNEAAPDTPVTTGHSGLVYLTAGVRYRISIEGNWSIWKVTL